MSIKTKSWTFNSVLWAWQWWCSTLQHIRHKVIWQRIHPLSTNFLCEQNKWKEDFWSTKHVKYDRHFKTIFKKNQSVFLLKWYSLAKILSILKQEVEMQHQSYDDPLPTKPYSANAYRHSYLLIWIKLHISTLHYGNGQITHSLSVLQFRNNTPFYVHIK